LEYGTPSPDDLPEDLGEFAEFFCDANLRLDPAPASNMLLLDDEAGSGDTEATIGIFLDACISDAVCEVAVQELLVPDPVPPRPVDNGTPFDLKSALGIDAEVPAAAAGSSMSGGAMLDMLSAQVCLDPGSGKIHSPTSDFIF
jgi:hypothetical protein